MRIFAPRLSTCLWDADIKLKKKIPCCQETLSYAFQIEQIATLEISL